MSRPYAGTIKISRNPSTVHAPLAGYSHQIEISGGERMLVLSGQVGMTVASEVPDDAARQFELALGNIRRNLEAAAMVPSDLVKLTFYLTEPIPAEGRAEMLDRFLCGHAPTMTLIFVRALASPALKVEIDACASTDRPG